jgi:inorganic pyrophosphatase
MIERLQGRETFFAILDKLVAEHTLIIDRPKGTAHPRYPDFIYPVDYGYLSGTASIDGGGIDVWLGESGERRLDAVLVTVDTHKKDSEIKLLLGCSEAEKETVYRLMNEKSMRAMLVRRSD